MNSDLEQRYQEQIKDMPKGNDGLTGGVTRAPVGKPITTDQTTYSVNKHNSQVFDAPMIVCSGLFVLMVVTVLLATFKPNIFKRRH